MAWDDSQTDTDTISITEWNNMVSHIKSVISSNDTVDAGSIKLNGVSVVDQDVTSGSSPTFNNSSMSGNVSVWTNDSGYLTSFSVQNSDISGLNNSELTNDSNFISSVSSDTSPQLGGDLDWNSQGTKLTSQTVGGSDGDAVYLSSSDTWSQADASAESTCSAQLGIRISSTSVLTHGVYTTTGLTAGSIYYVSETAGGITTTAPSTSTSIVRILGYALSTTELMVTPDITYIEVA